MRELLLLTFVVLFFIVILKICSTNGYSYYYDEEDPFYLIYRRQGKKTSTKAKSTTKSIASKKSSVTKKNSKATATTKKSTAPKKKTSATKKKTSATQKKTIVTNKKTTTVKKLYTTKRPSKNTKTQKGKTKKPTKSKKPKTTKGSKKTTKPTTPKPKPTQKVYILPLYPTLENYQVGAVPTKETRYPWVARVAHSRTKDYPHMCTAICVNDAIFITAARCLHNLKVEITSVKYKGYKFPVITFVTPSYPTSQSYEDIGIIVVNPKGFKKKWEFIDIELIDTKRTDNYFKWFDKLNYSKKKKGIFRVIGYAAEKHFHRIKTANLPKYELCEQDIFIDRKMCASILAKNASAPEFLVPCYMSCSLQQFDAEFDGRVKAGATTVPPQPDTCSNYHGVEGAAIINRITKKLVGIATWGAYHRLLELPVGFAIPNSNNYFMDYECARKIRDSPKPDTGSYQQICEE